MTEPDTEIGAARELILRQLKQAEDQGVEVEVELDCDFDAEWKWSSHSLTRGVPKVDGDGYVQLFSAAGESWWYPVLAHRDGDVPAIVGIVSADDDDHDRLLLLDNDELEVDTAPERLTLLSDGDLDELIRVEVANLAMTNERAREAIARLGIDTAGFPRVAELAKRAADLDGQLADHQLEQALKIAEVAMQFGQVLRTTEHPNGQPESDTTHTVMLGLLAIELAPSELRRAQLLGAVLVHDLVETYAKDTCTAWGLTDGEREHKAAREQAALEQLRALGLPRIVELIEDYERQSTPEARWVRYIDKICPKLTHLLNRGSALQSIGMTREDMISKHAAQAAELVEMYPEQAHARALYAAASERCEAELLGDQAPTRTVGHGARYSFTIVDDLSAGLELGEGYPKRLAQAARVRALDLDGESATVDALEVAARGWVLLSSTVPHTLDRELPLSLALQLLADAREPATDTDL